MFFFQRIFFVSKEIDLKNKSGNFQGFSMLLFTSPENTRKISHGKCKNIEICEIKMRGKKAI
jgi:hypothetical protein